jgi:hypothetical protein
MPQQARPRLLTTGDYRPRSGEREGTWPHLAARTAYIYSPSSCWVVNRTSRFDVEIDRSRLFHTDSSEMRLRARLDFFFPYTGAIARGTAVP